jgi:hypothetical protein
MPEGIADIVGPTRASFTFTIDSGTIFKAILELAGQPDAVLTVAASGREVTIPSLPAGDSVVSLALVWAPGDSDATIDVGADATGTVHAANPRHTIDVGDSPGYVELFGK